MPSHLSDIVEEVLHGDSGALIGSQRRGLLAWLSIPEKMVNTILNFYKQPTCRCI